jgi:hypothetical protein
MNTTTKMTYRRAAEAITDLILNSPITKQDDLWPIAGLISDLAYCENEIMDHAKWVAERATAAINRINSNDSCNSLGEIQSAGSRLDVAIGRREALRGAIKMVAPSLGIDAAILMTPDHIDLPYPGELANHQQ